MNIIMKSYFKIWQSIKHNIVIILNQEAKTSVKACLAGATVDTSWQVGTQIYDQAINNNGYVDFRDIHLNYPSIVLV